MISLSHIIKEMLSQRLRLWLTVLAIAWSTAAIALMLAVGEGMRINFGTAIANTGSSLLVATSGQTSVNYRGLAQGITVQLTEQDLSNLREELSDVSTILGEVIFQATLQVGNQTTWANPIAVTPDYKDIRQIDLLPGGRFINPFDMAEHRLVIVLGNRVAKALAEDFNEKNSKRPHRRAFIFNDPPLTAKNALSLIGKTVTLGDKIFTVIGVTREKMQLSAYTSPDDYNVFIPLTTYQSLSAQQNYSDFLFVPKDPQQNNTLREKILNIIARHHGYDAGDTQLIDFWDSNDAQAQAQRFFLGMQIFLGLIGTITLVVAGVGIANVMYVSVKKATRDIGIRMAIGAKTRDILWHYIIEALLATLIGGAIGLLLTLLVVEAINHISINGQLTAFIGNFKPLLSYQVVAAVIIILGIVGFMAAFFPARRASSIDPAKALQEN